MLAWRDSQVARSLPARHDGCRGRGSFRRRRAIGLPGPFADGGEGDEGDDSHEATRIMPDMPMEGDVGCETGFFEVKSPIPAEWQEGKRC